MLASFLYAEFLLHISCWFYFYRGSHFYVGSFSYTSPGGVIFMWEVYLTPPVLVVYIYLFIYLFILIDFFRTYFELASFFSGEFFLHIPCWLHFYWGSFSRAGFIFMGVVSLTHPMLASFLSGEFLLHIPCLVYISVGSFSYTSRAGFFSFFSFFFSFNLVYIPSWLHFCLVSFSKTSRARFIFMWGASLTHPM